MLVSIIRLKISVKAGKRQVINCDKYLRDKLSGLFPFDLTKVVLKTSRTCECVKVWKEKALLRLSDLISRILWKVSTEQTECWDETEAKWELRLFRSKNLVEFCVLSEVNPALPRKRQIELGSFSFCRFCRRE